MKSFAIAIVAVMLAGTAAAVAGGTLRPLALGTERSTARSEGIEVHGAWKIVVRNRSGRVVRRHAFHNALVGSGATTLSALLTNQKRVVAWSVLLLNQAGAASPCRASNGNAAPCWITEAGGSIGGASYVSKNLTVTNNGASGLTLQGTIAAQAAGSLSVAQTSVELCDTSSPCGSHMGFSQRNLPAAVSVAQGQLVQVTVRFTFS